VRAHVGDERETASFDRVGWLFLKPVHRWNEEISMWATAPQISWSAQEKLFYLGGAPVNWTFIAGCAHARGLHPSPHPLTNGRWGN
jgi:hypothetical protein